MLAYVHVERIMVNCMYRKYVGITVYASVHAPCFNTLRVRKSIVSLQSLNMGQITHSNTKQLYVYNILENHCLVYWH